MSKTVIINILINTVITSVFVLHQMWALQNSLEETFISFAILYGIVVVIVNAFYLALNSNLRPAK